jgi:acyl dehydratase
MSRHERLLAHGFSTIDHRYTKRDTILYALGCGAGAEELDLVYEQNLIALPALASMLAYPGNWYADPAIGLDAMRIVHGSERIELTGDLPVDGHVTATPRIVAIHDKGLGLGALIISQREIRAAETGQLLATVTQRAFCRGDGGLGGDAAAPVPAPVPDRAPDRVVVLQTSPRAAALYRLMGDDNPLHIDPAFAAAAGFAKPILHGLATLGHAARAILRDAPGRSVRMIDARFTAPVVPGDRLEVDLWDTEVGRAFRARVGQRVVIDNGEVAFGAG